jgi:hypothetical protein
MSNSSFLQFDSIVIGMKNVSTLKADANAAFDALIDSAYDPQAEAKTHDAARNWMSHVVGNWPLPSRV